MSNALKDKVVFITGASSGIGESLAREFARRGAHVALTARRVDKLEALAAELTAAGVRTLAIACDVTLDGDLEKAVAATREVLGPIDVVVANAGFGVAGRVDRIKLEDFRRQFETNVFGMLRTIYATLDDLKQTRGRLALIGSVSGWVSSPNVAPYAMSKFAVRALGDALWSELARDGVSVVSIHPGYVESEIRRVDNQGNHHPGARDPVPEWLQMPREKAARQIASAIAARKREAIITGHGKAIVGLQRLLPCVVARIMRRSAGKMRHRAMQPK